jgi:hypothetical protein
MITNKLLNMRINQLLFSLMLLTSAIVSGTASGGEIVPNPALGSEGEFIDLAVTLPTSFFRETDANAKADCLNYVGVEDAGWYLLFGFRGLDGSASWGDDSSGDLQFYNNINGDNYGAASDDWIWCLPSGSPPETVTQTQISLRLHNDFITEDEESAQFEWYEQFNSQVMASADVTITDVPDPEVSDLVFAYVSDVDYTRNGSAYIFVSTYNQGTANSSDYTISFRRSWDDEIDLYDEEFEWVSMPPLESGQFDFVDGLFPFPDDPDQTTPYWGYCIVDSSDEAVTSNNCSGATLYPLEDAPAAPETCFVSTLSCGNGVGSSLTTSDCESGPRFTEIGETFSGTPGFLAESFEFQGTMGQSVNVFADWLDTVDGYIYLEDPNGIIEELNDDYNFNTGFSAIENHTLAKTGTYKIWSTTYEYHQVGEYQLSLGCTSTPDEVYIRQFTASPSTISEGGEVSLHWETEGASQCYGDAGVAAWLGEKALNGSQNLVLNAAGTNIFTLTCRNESGAEASESITVSVLGDNPDLLLKSLTLNLSEVSTGGAVIANARFSNLGDGISSSSPVTWYLSTNEAISDADSVIATDELPSLGVGNSASESATITAPALAGAYWVGVCVDPVEGEPDTINNCSSGIPLSVLSSAACDISAIACGSNSSGLLDQSDCQSGPLGAGYYAQAQTFTGAPGQSVIIEAGWGNGDGYMALESPTGEIVIANDDFGDSRHSKIEYELQQRGTYKTWLTTFDAGAEPSFDLSLACPEAAEPNLAVTLTQGPPDELVVGEFFEVKCDIENIGNGTASESNIRYMLSTNPLISTSDTELGAFELSSMAPDTGLLEEWETELLTPGDYWFGACVDAVDGESLRGNNCTKGQRVSVRAAAECSSDPIQSGAEVFSNLSDSDCDQSPRGPAYYSKSFTFEGYRKGIFTVDAYWNGFDGYLYMVGPNGEVIGSNDDNFDNESSSMVVELLEDGQHTIWATSYSPEVAGSFELIMGENLPCEAGQLTAESITVDKGLVEDGEQVTVSAEIRASSGCGEFAASSQALTGKHHSEDPKISAEGDNQNSQLRYFLSTNNRITSGDPEVAKDVIDSIQAGNTSLEYALVEAPVTSGKYWIGACLDVIDEDCVVSEAIEVQSAVESIPFNSGMNDAWWDDSMPGQGILISVFPSSKFIFMAWFTYDTELPPASASANIGDPGHRWMTAYGFYEGNSATLDIELTSGGIFNSNNPLPDQNNDGTVQIQFTDCNVGRVIYDVPAINQQGTVEIKRVTRENLHLCEAAMTESQQLQSAVNIEAEPAILKTGAGTVISWQAPAGMQCVSEGGSGEWAEGIELPSSGQRKVRISAEGRYDFGMVCSDGISETTNVVTSTPVTAVNVEDNDTQKSKQKVLFNPGLNDAWFDPNTPGQGILLTVFPDTEFIFLAWFTFDTERPPAGTPFNLGDPGHRWMTAYGFYDGSTANLTLELTKGGLFDSVVPAPTQEDYGTLNLSFEHCNSGQMTFNIPSAGLTGTIPLQRGALDKVEECQALDGIDDPIDGLQKPEPKKQMPNKCASTFVWDFEWESQKGFQSYEIEIRNGRSENPVTRKFVYRANTLSLAKTEAITNQYLTGWRWRIRGFSDDTPLIQYGPWSEEWEFDVAPVSACN